MSRDTEQSGVYLLPPYQRQTARRLTRRAVVRPATIFTPSDGDLSPEVHFPLQTVFAPDRPPYPRFVNRFDSREMLLVVDGSCVNNGRSRNKLQDPVAGCSFMYKGTPTIQLEPENIPITFPFLDQKQAQKATGRVAFRLEKQGPNGEYADHTSNRAKLRAVIAALQFRGWDIEGWRRVVILTDLEYIVHGATTWLPRWVARRWRKPRGQGRYMNRDLWEELQHRVDELRAGGCEVSFWLVSDHRDDEKGGPSLFISQAKEAAQRAARIVPDAEMERFTKMCGIML